MRLSLFVPCVTDQISPHTAVAAAGLLRRLGHRVDYDRRQTCCGQALLNMGFRREASQLASRFIRLFGDAEAVVAPSGSCVLMVKGHYGELDLPADLRRQWLDLRGRVFELTEFLVSQLQVTDLGARFEAKAALHRSCHALYELHSGDPAGRLLRSVRGLELIESPPPDECCGFGGAFSVKFPALSRAISERRASLLAATGARIVTGVDDSCLNHLKGAFRRLKLPVEVRHISELLDSTSEPL